MVKNRNERQVYFMLHKIPDNLTGRDMDILNILWKSDESLTASQIASSDQGLTINTVQAVIRKLLKEKLIKIDNIVYSGTVLCRSYCPTMSEDDFALSQFNCEYRKIQKRISKSTLVSALLGSEKNPDVIKNDISELQAMLDEYKEKL